MGHINRIGLAGMLLLSGMPLLAAPVSPETAMAEARLFHSGNSSYYKKAPSADSKLTLAYTATTEKGNCFYVFNEAGGGYTIVTADDRLPRVIGFSENGEFDYERLPENMKWWLSQYTDEINHFLELDPQIAKRPMRARVEERKEIKPLLTSKWNQTEPYNNLCPLDPRTGGRSVTGCVATAMAQVMRHYQWPEKPTGSNAGYVFSGTTLDWANMLDEYKKGSYSATQATAVAELMRQCGASVNMMYSSYMSGAYDNDVPVAFYTYFGYDKSVRMQWRDYHTLKEWNDMVYAELEANRPLYYSGQSANGGHAFVCDGYLGNNFFHFNWGWGGYQDGYFLLNSLNPDSGGTGSYAGGYNANQVILTGLVKDFGSDDSARQVAMLATGNFTYANNNTYRITGSGSTDLIYNPMGYAIKVTFGLKFTNVEDPTKVTYSKASGTSTFQPYYGTPEIVCTTPSLPTGKYHVTPAIFTEKGEWEDVQVPYAFQRYVTLTVAGGKNTYTNEGAEAEGKAKLLAGNPQTIGQLYSNAPKAYRVTVSNVGEADFFGQVTLSLWYEDDLSGDGDEETRSVAIPAGSSMDIDFFLSLTDIKPGHYSVSVIDSNGFMINSPTVANYPKGDFPTTEGSDIKFLNITPNFPTAGGELGVAMDVENTGLDDITLDFDIALLNAKDLSVQASVSPASALSLEAMRTTNVTFAPRDIPMTPGDYFWVIRDKSGKWISDPMPVKAYGPMENAGGIYYQVTDKAAGKAMVVAPMTTDYSGSVSIPATLNGYSVTEVKADAFTFCDELTDVVLPAGVSTISNGQFYSAVKLKNLTVKAATPPVLPEEAFGEDMPEKINLSTAAGLANIYKRTDGWKDFNMSYWTFDFGDGVSVRDGLLTDPATGTYYTPYYVNAFEPLKFTVNKPEGKSVAAAWTIDGETGGEELWRYVSLPILYGKSGEVRFTAVDGSGVESVLGDDERADVYSVAGYLVKRSAAASEIRQLPAGLYIVKGRKVAVK